MFGSDGEAFEIKRRNFFEKPLTNGKTPETAFEGFQKDFENQREKGRLS
jgi:hypothetical protein